MSKLSKLSPKQVLFIAEYLIDLNATQAAIRAGYSSRTAVQSASRLLKNATVSGEIQKRMDRRAERLEITADRILQEIAKLAFMDPRKFFREDGSPKDITELDDDTAAALAGMDVLEQFEGSGDDRKFVGYVKKYKLVDKGLNLERLGKHLKLFTDSVEVSGPGGAPLELTSTREKLLAKLGG